MRSCLLPTWMCVIATVSLSIEGQPIPPTLDAGVVGPNSGEMVEGGVESTGGSSGGGSAGSGDGGRSIIGGSGTEAEVYAPTLPIVVEDTTTTLNSSYKASSDDESSDEGNMTGTGVDDEDDGSGGSGSVPVNVAVGAAFGGLALVGVGVYGAVALVGRLKTEPPVIDLQVDYNGDFGAQADWNPFDDIGDELDANDFV